MAKKKQVRRRVEGWRAKRWYRVYAPEAFGKAEIGNTISADPEHMIGRVITSTLGEIVQDYSKSHIKMKFKINNVAGDAAYTEFIGHEVTRDYLRSMIKRRASRIDIIHPVVTKDKKLLRVTVVCLTLSRAEQSQVHAVRQAIAKALSEQAVENDLEALVKDIVSGDVARDVFKTVKTIYPIRRVEITKSKLEQVATV